LLQAASIRSLPERIGFSPDLSPDWRQFLGDLLQQEDSWSFLVNSVGSERPADCPTDPPAPPKEDVAMDVNKPISGEFAALIPMLADTMKFATQALAQSSALAELLIEKGVVTKVELDERMSVGQELRESLMKKLDQEIRKQS
jgi:hypothetical protein